MIFQPAIYLNLCFEFQDFKPLDSITQFILCIGKFHHKFYNFIQFNLYFQFTKYLLRSYYLHFLKYRMSNLIFQFEFDSYSNFRNVEYWKKQLIQELLFF